MQILDFIIKFADLLFVYFLILILIAIYQFIISPRSNSNIKFFGYFKKKYEKITPKKPLTRFSQKTYDEEEEEKEKNGRVINENTK